jgi:hypothetical protein
MFCDQLAHMFCDQLIHMFCDQLTHMFCDQLAHMMMVSALYKSNAMDLIFIVLAHWEENIHK